MINEKKFKLLDKQLKHVKNSRIKWLCAELKVIKFCFKTMNYIGIPMNKNEKEELKNCIDSYDSSIKFIEKEFISKIRTYVS